MVTGQHGDAGLTVSMVFVKDKDPVAIQSLKDLENHVMVPRWKRSVSIVFHNKNEILWRSVPFLGSALVMT